MKKRTLISAAIASLLAAVSFLVLPSLDAAEWRESFSPRLLEPTGSHAVGVRRFRVDIDTEDPWSPGQSRVVMVDIHYPATAAEHPLRHYAKAPYMSELAMLAWAPDEEQRLSLHDDEIHWLFRTHSHEWAPPQDARYPVVVISAPRGDMRTSFTTLAEDLASHGHVVVTVDHPYAAPVVELWPTRRVIEAGDAPRRLTTEEADAARVDDVAAVTDRLYEIDDEIGASMVPDCVAVLTGRWQNALAGLTDRPMIEAQIAEHIPRIKNAVAGDRSAGQTERDFRARNAHLRASLRARLADEPGCRDVG